MNIEVLHLADNPLTELRALTLAEYPKMTSLYLYHTQIEKIFLPKLPVLEELVFSDSKITDLNWLITAAPSLPSLKNI
jgi:Leucine-rich repeat (LRR) protein